jgi:arylsulfatase A-like enzyme
VTGLYPPQHGVHNNVSTNTAISKGLKDGVVTFAERLKETGYSLHFSGKWHVSAKENPADRGWEELRVSAGKDAVMGATLAAWQNFVDTGNPARRAAGEIVRNGWRNYQLYGSSKGTIEETGDYEVVQHAIKRLESLKTQTAPWCLYIGTFGPHDPFIIPEKYAQLYKPDETPLPPNYHDDLKEKPWLYQRMRKLWDQLSEREVKG